MNILFIVSYFIQQSNVMQTLSYGHVRDETRRPRGLLQIVFFCKHTVSRIITYALSLTY